MHITMRYSSIASGFVALALSVVATPALAQSDAVRALYVSAANVPTNVPGINTYAEPPKGFNPVAATDEELATYGFPPRPDKQVDADHYALWERAMLAAKIRWNGELTPLPARGHGMIPAGGPSSQEDAVSLTGPAKVDSLNWSGVALRNTLKKWSTTASFNDIYTEISVPTTQAPFGAPCPSGTVFAQYSWAGIDGYPPSTSIGPPLRGGVVAERVCTVGEFYRAFVAWGGVNTVFGVYVGDVFYTEVIGFGGLTPGSVFVEDLSTLTYGTYSVESGDGTPLVGSSAQWIVERPAGYPLANTISIFFDGGAVYNTSHHLFYPGSQATTTAILTMRDDGNTQDTEVVSQGYAGYEGLHALLFQTTGCAFSGGCTP
jgi:hypothetical protein